MDRLNYVEEIPCDKRKSIFRNWVIVSQSYFITIHLRHVNRYDGIKK